MVRITNGVMTLRVTRQSFLSQYQPCGFRLLESSEEASGEELYGNSPASGNERLGDFFQEERDEMAEGADLGSEELAEAEEAEEDEEESDLSEIPISEMDYYQLCAYADQLGLDRTGLRSKKELRQLIRDNI